MRWDLKGRMVEGGHSRVKKWFEQSWVELIKRYRGLRTAYTYVWASWNVGCVNKYDKNC